MPVLLKKYIPVTGGGGNVNILEVTLNANGTYQHPGGLITHIVAESAAPTEALSIGITANGKELITDEGLPNESFAIGKFLDVSTTLYVSGVTSSTKLKFYTL